MCEQRETNVWTRGNNCVNIGKQAHKQAPLEKQFLYGAYIGKQAHKQAPLEKQFLYGAYIGKQAHKQAPSEKQFLYGAYIKNNQMC